MTATQTSDLALLRAEVGALKDVLRRLLTEAVPCRVFKNVCNAHRHWDPCPVAEARRLVGLEVSP